MASRLQKWTAMGSPCGLKGFTKRSLKCAMSEQLLSTKHALQSHKRGGRPHRCILVASERPKALPHTDLQQDGQMQRRNSHSLWGSILCSKNAKQLVSKERKGPPWGAKGCKTPRDFKPLSALADSEQTEADSINGGVENERKRGWQDWLGLATSLYPVYVLLGGSLAVVRPSSFAWFYAGGPALYSSALGIIMLSMGLTIGWEDLRSLVLGQPAAIAFGFAAQYVLMPLLGFMVSHALALPPALAAGVVLLSCCPGGTASNVVTFIGYGDVPLSVMMTICTTFGAVFMTPFLTQTIAGTLVPIDAAGLAFSTLQVVLLPVLLGMACKNYFPRTIERILPFAPLTAVLTSSLLASSVLAVNVPLFQLFPGTGVEAALKTASLATEAVPSLGKVAAAVFLVHAGGFGLGYLVAVLAGFSEARRRAISIEVGMQNSSLGVVLATKHFASPLAPLPCAVSAIMMNVMGSALAAAWRQQGPLREDSLSKTEGRS